MILKSFNVFFMYEKHTRWNYCSGFTYTAVECVVRCLVKLWFTNDDDDDDVKENKDVLFLSFRIINEVQLY